MNVILDIGNELKSLFPEFKIYRENVKQGFKSPAFFIYERKTNVDRQLANYQLRSREYVLMFFADKDELDNSINQQHENVRTKLLDEFNFLNHLKLHLNELEMQKLDDDLQIIFKVEYRAVKQLDEMLVKQLETIFEEC